MLPRRVAILFLLAVGLLGAACAAQAKDLTPFKQPSQWIWYVSKAGNSANAIAKKAKKHGIKTVFIKSGDGTNYWSQFTEELVQGLHDQNIYVCGWQYAYGRSPVAEAKVLARAKEAGADCVIIDAEVEWEAGGGKYGAAAKYMKTLRKRVGNDYPVGLSGFPYVHYHPSFPFSAFFAGEGGADVNIPQVYWKAIGTSVSTAMSTTQLWNELYGKPIAAAAGTWLNESTTQLKQFQLRSKQYGWNGISYWAWQFTKSWQWPVLAQEFTGVKRKPKRFPALKAGSKGDPTVWLQIKLNELGYKVKKSGYFYSSTTDAVKQFQTAKGLPATGVMDKATWEALLAPSGSSSGKKGKNTGGTTGKAASLRRSHAAGFRSEPRSARLKPLGSELPPKAARQ